MLTPERLASALRAADWPHRAHSRLVRSGGIDWHVQLFGAGPPALLIHGSGASAHSFAGLLPLLAEHYTVIAPDLPGHGFSSTSPRFTPSLPATAAALEGLLEVLQLTPALAVGHSAGAAVLAQMALDGAIAPELLVGLAAALVPFRGATRAVFLPTARLLARSRLAPHLLALQALDRRAIARMLERTGSKLDAQGLARYQHLARQPAHVAAVLAMLANWDLEPLYAQLDAIPTRTLLLAGARDLAVPNAAQRQLVERLPHARLSVLSGLGHLLHEERPAEIARLILDER